MFIIDIRALKGKQGESSISNTKLAEKLGISRNTLATYYKHPEKMPYDIIARIPEILSINAREAKEIFFKEKLTKNAS